MVRGNADRWCYLCVYVCFLFVCLFGSISWYCCGCSGYYLQVPAFLFQLWYLSLVLIVIFMGDIYRWYISVFIYAYDVVTAW